MMHEETVEDVAEAGHFQRSMLKQERNLGKHNQPTVFTTPTFDDDYLPRLLWARPNIPPRPVSDDMGFK